VRRAVRPAAFLAAVLFSACAHYPVNPKLAAVDPAHGYRFGMMNDGVRDDETFVVVTMSGGGTRAAALAYGVLQKLAATPVRGGTMLDKVDVVSSVSGGSFTAAWYALHGKEGLPEFRRIFLEHDIQGDLMRRALNPLNWPKLLSPRYSRIDLAADYYDQQVFKGATYAQMPKSGRPYTILNGTEMDLGTQFTFVQEQFDAICSDLDQIRVARAAAAASAFPGLLVPMTFRNYAGQCGYVPGTWFSTAAHDYVTNPRRFKFRNDLAALMRTDRPFLHVMDGGIADNVGARGPLHAIASMDTLQMNDTKPVMGFSVQRLINLRKIKRVAVIVVNAKTSNQLRLDKVEKTPSLPQVISTISNTPMGNYSFDTVALMQSELKVMQTDADDARADGDTNFPFAEYYFVDVAFGALPDAAERKAFDEMGTNFHLPPVDIQKLVDVGTKILDGSAEFQRLVKALQ
jgi:NTE family protein